VGPVNTLSLWVLLMSHAAQAARNEVAIISVNDRVSPADLVTVEVLTLEDGTALEAESPTLQFGGELITTVESIGNGRWRATLSPLSPAGGRIETRWRDRSAKVVIPPVHYQEAALIGPSVVKTRTGQAVAIPIKSSGDRVVNAGDVLVWSGVGESTVETSQSGTVEIVYHPGQSPYPRSIPVIVQHDDHLSARPYVFIVQVSAQPTIPVQTEPGAEATMTVGGKEYGPLTADEAGAVSFQVSVPPGTDKAEVSLKDPLGNQQTSSILLGGATGPQITLAHTGTLIDGGITPAVYIAASTARGAPWGDPAPTCTGLSTRELNLIETGLWRATTPAAGATDQRIECRLPGGTVAELLVPIERSRATRLVLQSYPGTLSTDIPVAEIQAYLLNGVGERLPPMDIELDAEFGAIVLDQPDGRAVVRGRYDGTSAILHGEDLLRASWKRPAGDGGVWDMAVRATAPGAGQTALLDVRTVDQGGRPLPNLQVEMKEGDRTQTGLTGEFGWASSTFDWPKDANYTVLEAAAGGLVRRSFVTQGTRPGPAAGAPDLITEILVPIHPGRVHGVVLNIRPRTLTNDGMVGTLEVHLEDQAGNRVTGQTIDLTASTGVVGPITIQPNGDFSAQYAPPVGMSPGRVRLTASTDDGRFSAATDVEVIPRYVDWSLGIVGGYLVGGNALHAPAVGFAIERRLPVSTLYLRVDATAYSLSVEGVDPTTGMDLSMETTVAPLGIGTVVRRGVGRFPGWVGGQAVFAPYSLQASFDGVTASDGMGWMSPGASFLAGVGWRTGGGEVFAEGRYIFLSAPGESIGWVGSVGGMLGTIGYKLLY